MRSRTDTVDTLIIGQGLAGTTLAWELERRGEDFLIIDQGTSPTASLVAAGLITPVTGKRFTVAEHFDELAQHARQLYQSVEARLGQRFYFDQPALRLVYDQEERERFRLRADALAGAGHIELDVDVANRYVGEPMAFFMPQAARLTTSVYLHASRRFFEQRGQLLQGRVRSDDVMITDHWVSPGEGYPRAQRLIFCGGHQDQFNHWLPQSLFNRAKGEILTVKLGLNEHHTVHAFSSWLCPTGQDSTYLFGSTYQHDDFDEQVTEDARTELLSRLSRFVLGSVEVLAQHFGVRPVGLDRKAIVGRHPEEPRIAWLNGLGSKGALLSPYLAAMLAKALLHDQPVETPLTGTHVSDACRAL